MEKENILKELSFQKVIEVEKTFHFKNNLLQESGLKNLTNATTTFNNKKGSSASQSLYTSASRSLYTVSRSLYTLAVIIIKFKKQKMKIPNSIYVRKHRS